MSRLHPQPAALPFAIDYRVGEAGWATACFTHFPGWPDGRRFAVSYLHDTLPELLLAACHAVQPPPYADAQTVVSFVDEPGELLLTLSPAWRKHRIQLALTEYPDWFSLGICEPGSGQPLGGITLDRLAFGHIVNHTMTAIRAQLSPADYEEHWGSRWPTELHDKLRALLQQAHPNDP